MGGLGSGRERGFHSTTDMYRKLSISMFRRALKYPAPHLNTSAGRFNLLWTPCNLGGWRAWFACPGCGCRVGAVFAPWADNQGRGNWRCRHCHGLKYASQLEASHLNAVAQVKNAARPLGLSRITHPELVARPSGMHRRTFGRLFTRYEEAYRRYEGAMVAFLADSEKRIGELREVVEGKQYMCSSSDLD